MIADRGPTATVRTPPVSLARAAHSARPGLAGSTSPAPSRSARSSAPCPTRRDGGRSRESSVELVDQRPAARPQRQVRGISLPADRRFVPERVHRRGGSWRATPPELIAKALEQRHRERIGLVSQARDVALGDLHLAGQLRAPRHEGRGAARHQRDAADGGPTRRRAESRAAAPASTGTCTSPATRRADSRPARR